MQKEGARESEIEHERERRGKKEKERRKVIICIEEHQYWRMLGGRGFDGQGLA